ncbi:MAG: methyl-accepting chemotaxis protein [Cellulomonas sp.]
MSALASLSIRQRVLALVAVTALGLAGISAMAAVQVQGRIMTERKAATRAVVETALGIVARYGEQAAAGDLTMEQAQAAAIAAVRELRYSGSEYFWINDMHPTMVMHPVKPELDGTDLTQNVDPDGNHLFVEFVDVVKAHGAGFVAYQWPKPGADSPQPKVSYVAGYEPWGWIVGSGIYVDDVRGEAITDARGLLLGAGGILVLVVGLSLVVTRSIVRPIVDAAQALASGDLSARLDPGRGTTELDHLAIALNATLDRSAAVASEVTGAAEQVSSAAHRLVGTSEAMGDAAAGSTRRTAEVATSAQEVSNGMDTVASGTTQMGASISEIARNANAVARIAAEAVDVARRTNRTVAELGESSAEIGNVVKVITAIAAQTNLLALNATIEAARAGSAGKGFAVVAGEVKELASETARATGDIAGRIDAIQAAALQAAGEISQISQIIDRINDYQGTIAGAVEEQTATTSAMAQAVAEVAMGGRAMASNLEEVERAAQQTTADIDGIREAARDLAETSQRLQQSVLVLQG